MNRFLSGVDLSKFPDPAAAHLIYDSALIARNASEYLPTFPIPGRRKGANTIGFADTHVKVVRMPASDDAPFRGIVL